MIEYNTDDQSEIGSRGDFSVKVIGVGGAGANVLDRMALEGSEEAELLTLNTDLRALSTSVSSNKIQLGATLLKGMGAGGDPELGKQAALEAVDEIRNAVRGYNMVFVSAGLGGGTGSGAAPIVVRLAREAGAFVVVFATMPFAFEGRRRRMQAEESLNQLAVLANALVTFDNGRMGELVLPKQGVHEAFSAADRMISDSITAVARLVLRPGLINVGLDELMSALKTNRSRCLFGSGLGRGENRAQTALKAALNSPLLDRGSLLGDATTVLVHICGGDDMTLYEVELLMQGLTKFIPDDAHLLFGAATDSHMKDALSVTIISALPEERLQALPVFDETDETEVIEIEGLEEELAKEAATSVVEEEREEEEPEEEEPEGLEDEDIVEFEVDEEIVEEEENIEIEDEEIDDFAAPDLKIVAEIEEDTPEAKDLESEAASPKKDPGNQGELLLDGAPKGRFDGEKPNAVKDGEDLDIPPYLRRRGRRR